MNATLGLIAEYASLSADGKLSLLGIFDQLSSATFPAGVPIFYVAVSLSAGPAEFDTEKKIELVLLSEDGKELLRGERKEIVPRPSLAGIRSALNLVTGFPGIGFVNPGTYQFAVVVDGRTEIEIPLYITRIEGEPA